MIIDLSKFGAPGYAISSCKISVPKGVSATLYKQTVSITGVPYIHTKSESIEVICNSEELAYELFELIDLAGSHTEYELKNIYPERFI